MTYLFKEWFKSKQIQRVECFFRWKISTFQAKNNAFWNLDDNFRWLVLKFEIQILVDIHAIFGHVENYISEMREEGMQTMDRIHY